MTRKKNTTDQDNLEKMPNAEEVARELGKAKSIDDFYPVGCQDGAEKKASLPGCFRIRLSRCWNLS